jgi:hypothetical protein
LTVQRIANHFGSRCHDRVHGFVDHFAVGFDISLLDVSSLWRDGILDHWTLSLTWDFRKLLNSQQIAGCPLAVRAPVHYIIGQVFNLILAQRATRRP